MQVSKILNSVRSNLRQRGSNGNFTSSALVDYLNDSLLEVADELQFLRKKVELTPNDDGQVFIPDDLLTIEIVANNGIELQSLSARNSQLYSTSQIVNSYGYIVIGNALQVKPSSTLPVTLIYIARPAEVDNEDQTIDINESYRMTLVYSITAKCFAELRDSIQTQYYEQKYAIEADKRRKQLRKLAYRFNRGPAMTNPR